MKLNCKPGDIAYLVRAELPENIGKVVEVVRLHDRETRHKGIVWQVNHAGKMNTVDACTGLPTTLKGTLVCPDSWLRPIGGVPVEDEVKDDIKEPA